MRIFKKHNDAFFRTWTLFGIIKIRTVRTKKIAAISGYFENEDDAMFKAFEWHLSEQGYMINWENPRTFTEKILWLWKYYYDRLPDTKTIQNKETFKDWMREKGFGEYIPKTLGLYDGPDKVDFDALPDKFVLKAAIGSFGKQIMLVGDKSILDKKKAIKQMAKWGKSRIIAEELLSDNDGGGLNDYKFFCLNGRVRFITAFAREKNSTKVSDKIHGVYNADWTPAKYKWFVNDPIPHGDIPKPKHLNKMIKLAEKISAEFPLVRVDMYLIGDKIYVGELTFRPSAGRMRFEPAEWDFKIGDMLVLPDAIINLKGNGK